MQPCKSHKVHVGHLSKSHASANCQCNTPSFTCTLTIGHVTSQSSSVHEWSRPPSYSYPELGRCWCGYELEHTSLYGPTPICALDTPLTCIGVHPLATHLIKSACENALMHASGHRVYEGIRGITTPPLSSVTCHEPSSMWIHSPHSPFESKRYVVRTVKPIGKVFSYIASSPYF